MHGIICILTGILWRNLYTPKEKKKKNIEMAVFLHFCRDALMSQLSVFFFFLATCIIVIQNESKMKWSGHFHKRQL